MKLFRLVLLVWLLYGLGLPAAFGCKHNVRDVGFVDLGDQSYGLFLYVGDSVEEYIVDGFEEVTNAELRQANVEAITINVDATPDNTLLTFFDPNTNEIPAMVFVSPDEKIMAVDSIVKGDGYKESLRGWLERMISSPFRKLIAEKSIESYGLILIVEGVKPEANKKARSTAQAAIDYVTGQMEWLPKQVGGEPVILTMSREQQLEEKVLLWSLGIDSESATEPYAVVLYGRGRLMGMPLFGKYLTAENLARFFYVIGADCECNLDRSLMQGKTMPARWDDEQQQKLYEQLGFDTENPMTKFEISRTLRRGPYAGYETFELDELVEYLKYQIVLDIDEPGEDNVDSDQVVQEQVIGAGEEEFRLLNPLYVITVAAVIIVVVGFFVMSSGKKQ